MGLGVCLLLWASCTKNPDLPTEKEVFKQRLLQANNAFSIKVLQQSHFANDSTNTVFSPFSVSTALSFVANGAEGTTREAMLSTLEMGGLSLSDVNQTMNELVHEMATLDPAVQVKFANSLWYSNGLAIKTPFDQINQLYYQLTLQPLNFADNSAPETINNWVWDATSGNVQQIVSAMPAAQGLYAVSSLWFDARFKQAFDNALTTQQPFYVGYGQTVPVQMMSGRGMQYGYYADNYVKIADLPYENSAYSLTIAMPADANSLNQLIAELSSSRWDTWMNGLSYHASPNLFLPKFSVGFSGDLKSMLGTLGMGNAFADGANFSNIADAALSISDVRHKTSLTVLEAGAIAPNTTGTATTTFTVNKPFIVAVRETNSGRILMIGKVMNPNG